MIVHVSHDAFECVIEGSDFHERFGIPLPVEMLHGESTTFVYTIEPGQALVLALFLREEANKLSALRGDQRDPWLNDDTRMIRLKAKEILECLHESQPA